MLSECPSIFSTARNVKGSHHVCTYFLHRQASRFIEKVEKLILYHTLSISFYLVLYWSRSLENEAILGEEHQHIRLKSGVCINSRGKAVVELAETGVPRDTLCAC